ncbi:hypothetical protein [Brevibacillus sp. VP]|uniref:hypothetical protein n=1 Tax=unclassified Brevibacillus TaxID=2684853 RepID=UPI000E2F1B35|nr:hypothetical protein [Brevibacillus sp. VP]RFB35731.1 hypothetical protein DZB91_09570 [Brevibacillus sp. VP]
MVEIQIKDMLRASLPPYCLLNIGRPPVKDDEIFIDDKKIKIPLEIPVVFFELSSAFDNPTGYGHNKRLKGVDLERAEYVHEKSTEMIHVYWVYVWLPLYGKYGGELTKLRINRALFDTFAFEDRNTLKFEREIELPPDERAIQVIYELTHKGTITKEQREAGVTDIDLSFSFE